MRRFLSVLGLLLALYGAGVRPAEAYPAGFTAALSGSPCTGNVASLDFAANSGNGVYCLNRTRYSSPTFIPGWSFTRASTGYALNSAGTLVSFGSGVPRITGLGLLIEPAATNLVLQSQAMATAPWTLVNATVTNNAGAAPDGTLTATSISPSASLGAARQTGIPTTAGTTYTFSVYLKWLSGNTALSINTVDSVNGTITHAVTINGTWAQYSFQYTPAATVTSVAFYLQDRNASSWGTFLAWGAQGEVGSSPSSYIVTTTTAVTRAADALTLTYAPAGSAATVTYGTNSTASVSPTSPINLGSSSGGAWVGAYIRKLVVTP